MRSVITTHHATQPVVTELVPPPVGPGDVRVTVAAAAFTYFDAFVASHADELGLPDQVGLGFDFSGTVTEVGPDVVGITVGDRVAGLHTDITAPARAHSDEVVIGAGAVAVVPEGLTLEHAAAVPLSALTARQALDRLGPERGRLLVTGAAGAVGAWVLDLATGAGWDLTALVRPGTEHLVDAPDATVVTTLEGTFDAVVDAAVLHEAARGAVRDGGRYVGFQPGRPLPPERGITVHTVEVQADGRALATLLARAAAGAVAVRIAGQGPLADAPAVYERALTGSGSRGRWLLVA